MKVIKYIKLLFAVLVVCSVGFVSCDEEFIKATENEIDYSYFPLEVGSYVSYQLDSIIFDDFAKRTDSFTMFVRELVESTFLDASGDENYRIERAYKRNEGDNWGDAGYDIWSSRIYNNNAEKVEENQRYIKLAFPLQLGKKWAGNQFINTDPIDDGSIDSIIESPLEYLEGWEYEITAIHEPMTLGSYTFDSTLTVVQNEYGIQIDTIGAIEVYAKNIGLIKKELWVVSTNCSWSFNCAPDETACKVECFNSTWLEKGENGFALKMKLIDYGKL